MDLPRQTKEIFERLSKGKFICQNSPVNFEKRLFDICDKNSDILEAYFKPIGFDLQYGPGYYYFSKELQESQIEAKLEHILQLLDYIEMFYQYDEHFNVNWRGSPIDLAKAATDNIAIKERIEKIKGIGGKDIFQKCEEIFKKMERDGFMALEDEYEKRYVVLTSYNYLVDFFKSVKEVNSYVSA
ncbi:hypothetical protein RZR97_01970 [Hydrogenimonas thermophila]|uniref:condensin complex protein MksE n=1 Tax=Hydrogenimonas thermophila TaxID=223786 RepID=UPI002936EDE8|nr:hypothetical protein [Hydrogenimonas thermophila]WOE70351.1 hypothetical protein RZR91_01980 [Hydrogenimonas thermophila]WOE72868.1 hypothetical protein RZR97_01970 [Hydrogenimonas thermophila]